MSPFDYIAIAVGLIIVGAPLFYVWFCTSADFDDAGVHLDDHNSIDLAEVYRDPIGFEPHGVRDTFVPCPLKEGTSLDDLLSELETHSQSLLALRALTVIREAREIMDQIEPCGHNEELMNSVSNWLVRGER